MVSRGQIGSAKTQGVSQRLAAACETCERLLRSILTCGALMFGGLASPAAAADTNSSAVKAGFLYNFAQFASWPPDPIGDGELRFCVEDGTLDPTVFSGLTGATIGSRLASTTFVDSPVSVSAVRTCDLLFVSSEVEGLGELRAVADAESILLISDRENFAKRGGHIELFIAGRNIRFRINLGALETSQITLSSKVLRLAEIIE